MKLPSILQPLLRQVETQTLHHALLFYGPDSVDKWTWAKWFAQFVLCEQKQGNQLCGQCRHCRYFNQSDSEHEVHPDVLILGDDLTQAVGIDDIRQISEFLILSPHYAKQKLVLIRSADTLNEASQNALLKILEEPPPYALFVLVSDKLKRLLPTIASRCVKYRFQSVSIDEAMVHFEKALEQQNKVPMAKETMKTLILLTEGNITKALAWLDSPIWQYREALLERFVLANEKQKVQLHQILHTHALDALYLIYLGLCDLLKLSLQAQGQSLQILEEKHVHTLAAIDRKNILLYLEKIQQAIRDTQNITGMNKILMFQNLYACAKHYIGAKQ